MLKIKLVTVESVYMVEVDDQLVSVCELTMGARRHGQGGGHMPPLENSKKCIQKYVNVTVIGCYML